MTQHQVHSEAGFTLVEVLIALVIFMVGILGVGLMQLSAMRGNTIANQVTEATVFGSDQIETIMSLDYDDDDLDSTNNSHTYTLDGTSYTADGHAADDLGHYDAYWEVEDDTPADNSKTIKVTVVWELKGEQKSLTLSTVKAE